MRASSPRPVVHLVHPPPYGEVPFKHLGLAYVAAGLRAYGFDTSYHDLSEQHHRRGEDFYDDLILRLSRRAGEMSDLPFLDLLGEVLFPESGDSPLAGRIRAQARQALESLGDAQVVGMSFNTLTTYFVAALGRMLRERGVRVVLGGPLSSIAPLTHLLLRLGAADVVLSGPGDVATGPLIDALLDGRGPTAIPGAVWVSQGAIRANATQPVPPLDALPWPELAGNVLDWFVPLQASRGCTRRCLYCSETGIWGRGGYERRASESVLREMSARAEATGLHDFHFHDDLLNGSRAWMDSFVRQATGLGFKWESFFEPYGLDEALLASMAGAGCRLVKFGVQSFSPSVLKAMGRAPRPEAIVQAVVATYRAGMSTHYDMLIGHPGETEEDHQLNLTAVEDLYAKTGEKLYFSLNPFYLAAGSEIERSPERFGVELVMADPHQLPQPLAEALAAGPPYPMGYRSAVPKETTMRRMSELAEILRKHGKDYLYLGQEAVPEAGPRGRRMLPALPDESGGDGLVEAAERRGRELADAAVITLSATSNLRSWAGLGQVRSLVAPGASRDEVLAALRAIAPSATLRIAGGEPTLSEHLPSVVSAARRAGLQVTLETNGLRFSHQSYGQALLRLGLSHVVVLLLDTDPRQADAVGGVDGAFELAARGIAALLEAGATVEVGLIASAANVSAVGTLADVVHDRFPAVRAVRVVIGPLAGPGATEGTSREALRPMLDRLARSAARWGIDVSFVDVPGAAPPVGRLAHGSAPSGVPQAAIECAGKIALVTGASRGIGAAVALRLASEGAAVALAARSLDTAPPDMPGTLLEVVEAIESRGGVAIAIQGDVADAASRKRLVAQCEERLGPIDVLVNNAACGPHGQLIELSDDSFQQTFELNVRAVFDLCRLVLPGMRKRRCGWIVNISSATALDLEGPPYQAWQRLGGHHLYAASKAALARLTAGFAAELQAEGIAVNALSPSLAVRTPGFQRLDMAAHRSDPRFEPVEAMAEAVLALCTCDPAALTGRQAFSLPLLEELRRPIRGLDGLPFDEK